MCKSKCNGETPKRRNGYSRQKFLKCFGRSFLREKSTLLLFSIYSLFLQNNICIFAFHNLCRLK